MDLQRSGLQVKFTAPTDWRCNRSGTCITCWNVGGHVSTVLVDRDDGRPRSQWHVPEGKGLQMCLDGDAPDDA